MNKLLGAVLFAGLAGLVALVPRKAKAKQYAEEGPGPLEPSPEEEDLQAEQDAKDRATWERSLGKSVPSQSQIDGTYAAAMSPDMTDLGQLRVAYNFLHLYGTADQAGAVAAKIEAIESGSYMPGPKVTPGSQVIVKEEPSPVTPPPVAPTPPPAAAPAEPAPPTPPPLAEEEQAPDLDPNGTIALARLLVDRETEPKWKSAYQPQVTAWQGRVGLTADGKFGPKSAEQMAQEVGILPLVRYWSGWQKSVEVNKYKDALRALAFELANDPDKAAHAAALRASADREQGQAWPKKTAPAAVPMADFDAMRDSIQATLEAEGS